MTDRRKSRGKFELACGTVINLMSLDQSSTYGGMLEGYPNPDMNAGIVQRLVKHIEKKDRHTPYLIAPTERQVQHEVSTDRKPWVELPSIQCTAFFYSKSLGEFGSSLFLCWYQEDFAFPIDPSVLKELYGISWPQHARPHDDF